MVYITAGPDFGAYSQGKNLIIDKSLYLLKISAARFHEHLNISLLRLGFKNTKHDPDLWMVEKASHYEYLVTYMDDILIWIKDLMAVIKSLEMTYMVMSVGTLEYCLGGNVEFFGEFKDLNPKYHSITIYDLFLTISRIGSCVSNRDVKRFKYLKHCLVCQTGM
jgi:hypothetical protein